MDYSQTIVTPENIIPIPVPAYLNTFKENDKYDEEDKKNNRDNKGRKTRTPAPKVKDQSEYKDSPRRKRSGNEGEHTNATN